MPSKKGVHLPVIANVCQKNCRQALGQSYLICGAEGGSRTYTPLLATDFKFVTLDVQQFAGYRQCPNPRHEPDMKYTPVDLSGASPNFGGS